jgi:hypothetical protein
MEVHMRIKALLLAIVTPAMLIGAAPVNAQQEGMKPMPEREGMPMQQQDRPQGMMGGGGMMGPGMMGPGMMGGGGMMGMMDMMRQCPQMMGAHRQGHVLPQLPPGNEKLQLQMHAEIMQRVGEILGKYAAQIK